MHNRLKVKTTEQQRAELNGKHKVKSAQLDTALTSVLSNRDPPNLESLRSTEGILTLNPDIATLWNIRREILSLEGQLQLQLSSELSFTQRCLKVQPKSYSIWHHRSWVLLHSEHADWLQELALCSDFLTLDTRNFHCWDHRRFVIRELLARKAYTRDAELEYTLKKVSENFSNFSSWHQRSKFIDLDVRTCAELLTAELELVHKAVFTDPSDQSPWYYHSWMLSTLVSSEKRRNRILALFCRPASPDLVTRGASHLLVIYFQDVASITAELSTRKLLIKGSNKKCAVHSVEQIPSRRSYSHTAHIYISASKSTSVTVSYRAESVTVPLSQTEQFKIVPSSDDATNVCPFTGQRALNPDLQCILADELIVLSELQELEPDNSWCCVALAQLLRLSKRCSHLTAGESATKSGITLENCYGTLVKLDKQRSRYYQDEMSDVTFKDAVHAAMDEDGEKLELSGQMLSRITFVPQLCFFTSINLQGNWLRDRDVECLEALVRLTNLNLCNNFLISCPHLKCWPNIKMLLLVGNLLSAVAIKQVEVFREDVITCEILC